MDSDIVSVPRAEYQHWQRRLSDRTALATTPCHNRPLSWTLPPELLYEIFSYLRSFPATLYSISLVNYQWYLCATPILYKHVKIHNTYQWATFILTLRRKQWQFNFGSLVQCIDLSSNTSYFPLDADLRSTQHTLSSTINGQTNIPFAAQGALDAQTHPLENSLIHRTALQHRYATLHPGDAQDHPSTNAHRGFHRLTRRRRAAALATLATPHIQLRRHSQDDVDGGLQDGQRLATNDVNQPGTSDCIDLTYMTTPVVLSTSSLIQLAEACTNLISLDLSHTHVMHDSKIVETGDYISTLQDYAIQQGFTMVKVSIEQAIRAIGTQCKQLRRLKMQHCEWVTPHILWFWISSCPCLHYLDIRRSTKCCLKRLTTHAIRATIREVPEDVQSCLDLFSSPTVSLINMTVPLVHGPFHLSNDEQEWDQEDPQQDLAQEPWSNVASMQDTVATTADVSPAEQRHSAHLHDQLPQSLLQSNSQVAEERRHSVDVWNQQEQQSSPSADTESSTSSQDTENNTPVVAAISSHDEIRLPPHMSLKDFVLRMLKEGQDQGLLDLSWLKQ
ncbi:hypothetical protein DM01DRAFT_1385773 [Hesseltinella vesiculosa]|uniref:F-box domain-containing protein n=1 Tax=Hesseltinella vesiculosa TaxID=101127 RepID=A0A1X2G8H6_9FUNG|nr:hypothetical protein DM01DRAFT_1385773 [Hesseltinella vesiculosa]